MIGCPGPPVTLERLTRGRSLARIRPGVRPTGSGAIVPVGVGEASATKERIGDDVATVVSTTIIKRFTYRGDPTEEWSNKYYFTGAVPSDATAWKALADALIVQEKALYLSTSAVVRAYGHDSDDPNASAVWSYDYLAASATVAGTATTGTGTYPAGDQAAWIRWKTSRLTSPGGKAIYLRKYYHAVPTEEDSPTTADDVAAGWKTSAGLFATKMTDGTFIDGRTIRSRTNAETIVNHAVSQYITTRTLKRRGKRPH